MIKKNQYFSKKSSPCDQNSQRYNLDHQLTRQRQLIHADGHDLRHSVRGQHLLDVQELDEGVVSEQVLLAPAHLQHVVVRILSSHVQRVSQPAEDHLDVLLRCSRLWDACWKWYLELREQVFLLFGLSIAIYFCLFTIHCVKHTTYEANTYIRLRYINTHIDIFVTNRIQTTIKIHVRHKRGESRIHDVLCQSRSRYKRIILKTEHVKILPVKTCIVFLSAVLK